LKVTLDGPSLVTRAPGEAPRRFPLERLSIVVVSSSVSVPLSALHGCACAGVPVEIVHGNGSACAYVLPAGRHEVRRQEMLECFSELEGACGLYENWRLSQERKAIISEARRLQVYVPDFRPARAAEVLERSVFPPARSRRVLALSLLTGFRSLLAGRVARALTAGGYPPDGLNDWICHVQLVQDFTAILAWGHWGAAAQLAEQAEEGIQPKGEAWRAYLVKQYEGFAAQDDQRAAVLVERFTGFLSKHWRRT